MKAAKPWYLYLIECVDGSIYTGITVDLDARYAAHKNGSGARYTRSHPPARLLGFENTGSSNSPPPRNVVTRRRWLPIKRYWMILPC